MGPDIILSMKVKELLGQIEAGGNLQYKDRFTQNSSKDAKNGNFISRIFITNPKFYSLVINRDSLVSSIAKP